MTLNGSEVKLGEVNLHAVLLSREDIRWLAGMLRADAAADPACGSAARARIEHAVSLFEAKK